MLCWQLESKRGGALIRTYLTTRDNAGDRKDGRNGPILTEEVDKLKP